MASRAAAVEPAETPAAGRGLSRATFAAFRSRPFALLWANTFLFALSQAFQQFTLAWLALKISEDGETVFGLTLGAGTAVGLVLFALGLPVLALGLYAGALADRIDRRLLLFGSQLAGIAVTATAAALMAAGLIGIWSTFALALLLGATLAFGQPVRMAILPSLVTPARVLNAVTLTNLGLTSSQMLGQPISGLLINLGGIETAFAAQSALLTLGLAPLLGLRVPRVAAEGARRLREELREGLAFVAGHAGIRALMFVLLATALVMAGTFMALLPRIAREELGAGAFAASLLFGAMGPGTLMASLLLASAPRLRRAGLYFLATLVAGGVLNVALAGPVVLVRAPRDVRHGLERGLLHEPEHGARAGAHAQRAHGPRDEHLHHVHGGRHAPRGAGLGRHLGCGGLARVVRHLRRGPVRAGPRGHDHAARPAAHGVRARPLRPRAQSPTGTTSTSLMRPSGVKRQTPT